MKSGSLRVVFPPFAPPPKINLQQDINGLPNHKKRDRENDRGNYANQCPRFDGYKKRRRRAYPGESNIFKIVHIFGRQLSVDVSSDSLSVVVSRGSAALFAEKLCFSDDCSYRLAARPPPLSQNSQAWREVRRSGGIAALTIRQVPEKQSFSANRAA